MEWRSHCDDANKAEKVATMDPALTGAMAALGGSFVGAMAPVLSNYVIQKGQTSRDLINHQILQRETLYTEFIREAARLYAKSMAEELNTLDELVALYALVSRLRLVASDPVLRAAEKLVTTISQQFTQENLTILQIEAQARSGLADPLSPFSTACRRELLDIFGGDSKFARWRNGR